MTRITWDAEAGTLYVYLSDELMLLTQRVTDTVRVDLSADAEALGVEILGVTSEPVIECIGRPRSGAGGDADG